MSMSCHVLYRTMAHTNISNIRLVPLHIHFCGKYNTCSSLTTKKLGDIAMLLMIYLMLFSITIAVKIKIPCILIHTFSFLALYTHLKIVSPVSWFIILFIYAI